MIKIKTTLKIVFLLLFLCFSSSLTVYGDSDKAKIIYLSGEASLREGSANESRKLIENKSVEQGETVITGSGRVYLENNNSTVKVKLYNNSEILYQGKKVFISSGSSIKANAISLLRRNNRANETIENKNHGKKEKKDKTK